MGNLLAPFLSAASYVLAEWICRRFGRMRPNPPAPPDYSAVYASDFSVEPFGECAEGSCIEVYRPATPFTDGDGRQKAVIFLHGFALGASQIYRAHLEHLAKQGFWVFYPNYQTGFCSFPDNGFRTFGELLDEVIGEGVVNSQEKWLRNALASVSAAYERAGFDAGAALDTYVYGHSLGGLFALSWPWYVQQDGLPAVLLPRQVLTADPIPTTASGMPSGKLGKALARLEPDIDVRISAAALTMPVAILHGDSDWVVPKTQWDVYFPCIATPHKRMFLSFTDQHGCPGHYANHEQATDDTSFFPPWLALLALDGVGAVDTLDWRYVWSALDQIIRDGVRADALTFDLGSWSDGRAVKAIMTYLPSPD
jgi:pimeloyl-ACP methyl ester carboxylesterase